ncbi:hypothetical protein [Chondromyces apiculatus]|uniref:ARB-07466-like C-terminal domain-containing protein n=1 Tax=Chondromyces apiculatus DSM 436 TaxID=1192034 RepID=A0A017TJH9_9BACT|nr:hypothetical protein [Chondromyces apiculatus]EYF08796.1 Hypothetical protein CAP_2657 [Chondromyces apiculatus DSM 436]
MAGEAPAIQAARRDANRAWPNRKKASDGTWGDKAHQARKSDHNHGDAIDITHDPASGADGDKIAAAAIRDPRVKYVIWNGRIYNTSKPGWRKYNGKNKHDKHVHISVKPAGRADTSSWGWVSGKPAPSLEIPQSKGGGTGGGKAPPKKAPPKKAPPKRAAGGGSGGSKAGGRRIIRGEHSVVYGSTHLQAAHVDSPHTGGGRIRKGSSTIFVGKKRKQAARIADPTTDNYNVITGILSIFMGG